MKKSIFAFVAVFLACSTQDGSPSGSDSVSENTGENETLHYTISPVDTIGIELGDSNYVFGQTDAALFSSTGDILVLDGSKKQISVFSSDGEFLQSFGRSGSGPGEFLRPMAMAILGNGQLAVSDPWAGKISLFNELYTYVDEISGFFPAPPMAIQGADGQAIVGLMKKIDIENDLIGYSLGRLDGTAEPVFIYAEEMMAMEPTMIGPGYTETTVAFASDLEGRVFTSLMSTDSYLIEGFLPGGDQFLSIQRPYDRVAKTPLEIEDEIESFNTFLENRETSGGGGRMQSMGVQIPASELSYEPDPYHYAISDLMIDTEERIWARRGYVTQPYFDVFDIDGNLLFTASVEEGDPDSKDWIIVIGDTGILGYSPDPLSYPKVIVLGLE